MQKLKIALEYCYGIKRLYHEIDFSSYPAVAIYAPNGAMKSSLTNTFQDIAEGKQTSDRIFPDRDSIRTIVDENDDELDPKSIMVVRPYDEDLGSIENTSTLLVNVSLRKDYEKLNASVEANKKQLLDAMKSQSGSKRNLEAEISQAFTPNADQFTNAILRISEEVLGQSDAPFATIPYDLVFDPKVVEMLGDQAVKSALEDYIRKFNELIDKSTYFRRGTFTYYNASIIAKTLADNGFFEANHSVSLNADEKVEIRTRKQLEDLVKQEKEGIASDATLRKTFDALEKLLTKNGNVRGFQAYISENEDILPALANIANFREKVWKSYFVEHIVLFKGLVEEIRNAAARKKAIEDEARQERTAWEEVIEIFNTRFFVPFELKVKNKIPIMLEQETIPKLGFTFKEGDDRQDVDRDALLEVLSTGEKRAFYILNILFEIQVRIKAGQRTIMVVDDIADSFDYKNKYAIIQFLKDISENADFRQIILTHNFDFFRTVQSRFVNYGSCFMVTRNKDGVQIKRAVGVKNVFVNDWKPGFGNNARKRIASIPFMRNLIEFTTGDQTPEYATLTSLLHIKPQTAAQKEINLFEVYRELFGGTLRPADGGGTFVLDTVFREADACLDDDDGANLENKIVLSIATRLSAEQYMIAKINDQAFVDSIEENQTTNLLRKFKKIYSGDPAAAIIDKVVLMTPENIHLNSFMYEPILDMSDEHLRDIYRQVRALSG